jgi:hypothetical protein
VRSSLVRGGCQADGAVVCAEQMGQWLGKCRRGGGMRGADRVWASSRRYGGLKKQVEDGRRAGGAGCGLGQLRCRTLGSDDGDKNNHEPDSQDVEVEELSDSAEHEDHEIDQENEGMTKKNKSIKHFVIHDTCPLVQRLLHVSSADISGVHVSSVHVSSVHVSSVHMSGQLVRCPRAVPHVRCPRVRFYYYSGRAICVYRAIHAGSLFFIIYDNRARHLQKGG